MSHLTWTPLRVIRGIDFIQTEAHTHLGFYRINEIMPGHVAWFWSVDKAPGGGVRISHAKTIKQAKRACKRHWKGLNR